MSKLVTKASTESWWIEYLEGELKDKDREMAEIILEKSPVDQLIVTNLQKLRNSLKEIDEKWVGDQPPTDWRALEEKIFLKMRAVDRERSERSTLSEG